MIETAYLFQSVIITLWWCGIFLSEAFFNAFQFPGIQHDMFLSFFIPDISVIAILSLVRAYKVSTNLQFIILGAFLYATLFCINAGLQSGGGLFPIFVMLLGLVYNCFLCYSQHFFRNSKSSAYIWLRALIQIACIWTLALGLIPFLLLQTFEESFYPSQKIALFLGIPLFVLCSILGLYSAFVMVRFGKGTPLPLDQTNELVTVGPYAYVRNPMAVAGIGQGVAISIIFTSVPILTYSIIGALVWHIVVKPIEEQDMLRRFGDKYKSYQFKVRCWIPKRRISGTHHYN